MKYLSLYSGIICILYVTYAIIFLSVTDYVFNREEIFFIITFFIIGSGLLLYYKLERK